MSSIKTTNRRVEKFLVAKQGQTAIPTSGNLYTPSLNDGQLAVASVSSYGTVALNTYVDATPTVAEAPIISLVQGTADSLTSTTTATATYPLWVRPYEISQPIDGRREVRVTKQSYRAPSHNTWILGDAAANAGAIKPLSNTTYTLAIAFTGVRQEVALSMDESAELVITFTTPDFSSTGLNYNDAQATSWIANRIAYEINRNSKALGQSFRQPGSNPLVAFVVDKSGASSGTAIGGVSPITAGSSVPAITTAAGTRNFTFTGDQATSIKNAALAVAGGVIADLTWEINAATLGATTNGDTILIMALDETTAFIDYVPQVKVNLKVAARTGFDTTTMTLTNLIYGDEGQGIGRVLDLQYAATDGQRKYSGRHVTDPIVTFPSPVDRSLVYTTYVFHHANVIKPDSFSYVERPLKTIVLIPQYSTGTTTNPYLATFEGVINSWLSSTPVNSSIITVE